MCLYKRLLYPLSHYVNDNYESMIALIVSLHEIIKYSVVTV